MNATFDTGSYYARSVVCAAVLAFAAFSVLPLSIAAASKPSREETLVRVYSLKAAAPKGEAAKGSAGAPAAPSKSSETALPKPSEVSVDFSKIGIEIPRFAENPEAFSLNSFGSNGSGGSALGLGEGLGGGLTDIKIFDITSLDKIPRRLNSAEIKYPPSLLRRGQEGEVRLNVLLDEGGNLEVESVESSTDGLFEASAIESASKLKYEPPTKNGEPVRARFVLPIPFKIMK